jgi:hypothetical protein
VNYGTQVAESSQVKVIHASSAHVVMHESPNARPVDSWVSRNWNSMIEDKSTLREFGRLAAAELSGEK